MVAVPVSCETLLQFNNKYLVLQMSAGLFFARFIAVIILLLFHMLNYSVWTAHKRQHWHSLTTSANVKAQRESGEKPLLHQLNWVLRCVVAAVCLCGITTVSGDV